MKKILALTLAVMMLLSLFAGCSNGGTSNTTTGTTTGTSDTTADTTPDTTAPEELEPVTLKMYVPNPELEGSADVLEAFNKKLAEVLPNTTLEIVYSSGYTEYFERWPMLLAGGEEMDIAWYGWSLNLYQDMVDGNLQPLNELMEQYAPNLLEEKDTWQTGYASRSLNSVQYAIPNMQPNGGTTNRLFIDAEYAEYFDVDAIVKELRANVKTTSRLWDLLEAGLQAAIDDGALTVGDNSWNIDTTNLYRLGARGYTSLLSDLVIDPATVTDEINTDDIIYYYEVPEVAYAIERIKAWVDKGWITQSWVAGQKQEGSVSVLKYNSSYNGDWYGRDERGVKTTIDSSGREIVDIAANTEEELYKGVSSIGCDSGMVIPYTSKNPERAMMLLNLLHDKPGTVGNDLANLLVWGFEADSEEAKTYGWANYKLNELEDGTVYADQSYRGEGVEAKHSIVNWVLGNTYYLMSDGSIPNEKKDFALDFWQNVYPNRLKCIISGMSVTTQNILDEMSVYNTIKSEYDGQIKVGAVDKIPELVDKVNASCMEAIKADLMRQIQEFLASK